MTYHFIVKCDLCGRTHELGWSRSPTETPGLFGIPDGWQKIKYATFLDSPSDINLTICPICDDAIRKGEKIVKLVEKEE